MSNRLYIDSVEVRYLRNRNPEIMRTVFGLIMSDDFERHEVLDFTSEAEIPATLEGVLRHVSESGFSQALDLVEIHARSEQGLILDGECFDVQDVQPILDLLAKEDEME